MHSWTSPAQMLQEPASPQSLLCVQVNTVPELLLDEDDALTLEYENQS